MMRYCFHVAGAVGVMMARVMGVPAEDHETLDRACDLGLAFQLVNIARDVSDDDAAGRCYLPTEWLAEADMPPGHADEARIPRAAGRAGRADARPRRSARGCGAATAPTDCASASAGRCCPPPTSTARSGAEVRAAGPHAWDHRIHTGALAKLGFVARAFVEALRGAPEPEEWPQHTRGSLMTTARMAGPVAPMPMTPLPRRGVSG